MDISGCWFAYGIVTVLLGVSSVAAADTACKDGYGLNYTLPMADQCKPKEHHNGSIIQTIPKLVPSLSDHACFIRRNNTLGIPPGHRICRFPDCDRRPCEKGWCEETMESYQCHCSARYQGKHCSENIAVGMTTVSTLHTEPIMTSDITTDITTTARITDPTAKIFVTDMRDIYMADVGDELLFRRILSSASPKDVSYDPVLEKIYWTDWRYQQVFRADVKGVNREVVTEKHDEHTAVYGIGIADKSRTLFVAYKNTITSLSIALDVPGPETPIASVQNLRALVPDEEQGYLYFTAKSIVGRLPLSGEGKTEELVTNSNLDYVFGLSIDFTRKTRRIFFWDFSTQKSFYVDMTDGKVAIDITSYLSDGIKRDIMVDVSYFNQALYWLKHDSNGGIAIVKDYDQAIRSFSVQTVPQFNMPNRMHIALVEP